MTTFLTKEEYLQQRANWKSDYKALSVNIRKTKNENKAAQKAHTFNYLNFSKINNLKNEANDMLDNLVELKKIAQFSYLQKKQA